MRWSSLPHLTWRSLFFPVLKACGSVAILASPAVGQNLVVNGTFATDLAGWTATPIAPTTITWSATEGVGGGGAASFARNSAATASNANYLYQSIPVTPGNYYQVNAFWQGDLLNGGTGRNWAEAFVAFTSDSAATPTNIVYKKATDGGPNDVPMPWSYESVLASPNGSSAPAGGIFEATAGYLIIGFNIGGRDASRGAGPGYFYLDDVSVTAVPPPPGVVATWNGSVDSFWSTAGNWASPPAVQARQLVFAGSNNLFNLNDYVTNATKISFAADAGSFTLAGNPIAMPGGASIVNESPSPQMIDLGINSDSGTMAVTATAGPISFTGRFGTTTGANATRTLAVSGPNTVTLMGTQDNQFGLGATIAPGATLVAANSAGRALFGANVVENGGTLRLGGADVGNSDQLHFNASLTLNGPAALFDLNGQSETIGKLLGSGGTVKNDGFQLATLRVGSGENPCDFSRILLADGTAQLAFRTEVVNAYTFGPANTFTGKMTLGGINTIPVLANGGQPSSIGAGSSAASDLAITAEGVLRYTGPSTSTDRSFTAGANATIDVVEAATDLVLTGQSFGSFVKAGAGRITLDTAAQAFSSGATLTVNAGTVSLGQNASGNMFHDSAALTIGSDGTFDLGGRSEKFGSIAGAGLITNTSATAAILTVSGFAASSTYDGVIAGNLGLQHTDGGSSTTLNGLATYSGNTTVADATAAFTLGATGGLTFYPAANGVTNMLTGAPGAAVTLDGRFSFDTVGAAIADGNAWTIVDAGLATTYGSTFTVSGFTGSGGDWTRTDGGNTWTFSQSTGRLSLAAGPTGDIVLNVASGTQTQAQAGYPTISSANTVTKTGAGTIVFDAANAYTGPTTVSAGTLQVANAAGLAATNVTVDTGATLAVAAGTTMKAPSVIVDGGTLSAAAIAINNTTGITTLAINAGTLAGNPTVTVGPGGQMSLVQDARVSVAVGGLSVDQAGGGGRLDLGAGQLTIAAGGISAADLRADIIAGRSGGAWNGVTGITSSAAASSGGTRGVGYVVAVDGSSKVSFAASGDVDLSGAVNVFDLVSINSSGKYGTGGSSVWSQGDFNYDGVTNVFDLVAVNTAGSYGQGNYFPAAPSAAGFASASAVPEPGMSLVAVGSLGGLAIACRWRRS